MNNPGLARLNPSLKINLNHLSLKLPGNKLRNLRRSLNNVNIASRVNTDPARPLHLVLKWWQARAPRPRPPHWMPS